LVDRADLCRIDTGKRLLKIGRRLTQLIQPILDLRNEVVVGCLSLGLCRCGLCCRSGLLGKLVVVLLLCSRRLREQDSGLLPLNKLLRRHRRKRGLVLLSEVGQRFVRVKAQRTKRLIALLVEVGDVLLGQFVRRIERLREGLRQLRQFVRPTSRLSCGVSKLDEIRAGLADICTGQRQRVTKRLRFVL